MASKEMSAAQNAMQMQQMNMLSRQAVLSNAVKMKQQIFSQSIDVASGNVINVTNNNLRNVGLLLGFIVEVEATVTNGAATQATRTPFGAANLVQQFRFDDLSNYTRVQVPGWHLSLMNTVRQGYGYGGVYANNLPMGYGDNFDVFSGPATIAADASADIRQVYYMPVSYSSTDLRGAIFMQTVSATANLQITLNQTPFVGATNPLTALYSGNANGDYDGPVTVTVYQVYLDQIPRDPNSGQYILPMQDLNTIYDLKQTTFSAITQGQDFPMPYSNFRAFLSTIAVFDNGGTFNGGSDVNYWSLVSANFTNLWRVSAKIAALEARSKIMTDMPDGTYLFESRDIPINTINFGNMELNLNASAVNNGARVLVGYESFGLIDQLVGASSLAGG